MTSSRGCACRVASLQERRERWGRLAGRAAEPGFAFIVRHDGFAVPPPPLAPEYRRERVEHAWGSYVHARERAEWLDDDAVPHLCVTTGTEIFAEAFGCAVHRPDDNKPFAMPLVHDAAAADRLMVPELGSSSLAYLFEMMDELVTRAGPGVAVRTVDIQSPMDIVALIWEKGSLFLAMLETPEAVKALAARVESLLVAFLDEWYARYGRAHVAHYPDYFVDGGITLSEDEVGAVSEEMFIEFFRPHLENLSRRYGGISIHCCADARHQWMQFHDLPGLKVINFNNPPTRKPSEYIDAAYGFFADVALQFHYGGADALGMFTGAAALDSGARVVVERSVRDREEAIRLCAELRALQASRG